MKKASEIWEGKDAERQFNNLMGNKEVKYGLCSCPAKCDCHPDPIEKPSMFEDMANEDLKSDPIEKIIELSDFVGKGISPDKFGEILRWVEKEKKIAFENGLMKGCLKGERNRIIEQLREQIKQEAIKAIDNLFTASDNEHDKLVIQVMKDQIKELIKSL